MQGSYLQDLDNHTYALPALQQVRDAFHPFRVQGAVFLAMDSSWGTLGTAVHIEFESLPEFNHTVSYALSDIRRMSAPDELSNDFGARVAEHIRTYRIEPEENIELGAN